MLPPGHSKCLRIRERPQQLHRGQAGRAGHNAPMRYYAMA